MPNFDIRFRKRENHRYERFTDRSDGTIRPAKGRRRRLRQCQRSGEGSVAIIATAGRSLESRCARQNPARNGINPSGTNDPVGADENGHGRFQKEMEEERVNSGYEFPLEARDVFSEF